MSTWQFPNLGTLQSKVDTDEAGYIIAYGDSGAAEGTKNFNLNGIVAVPSNGADTKPWATMYEGFMYLFGIKNEQEDPADDYEVDFTIKIDDQEISGEGE